MIKIIESISQWQQLRTESFFRDKKLGFVPTMGALHEGHRSLLKRCRLENDYTVLSIFVNPTQFDDPNDLEKYPSSLEADIVMAQEERIDYIFMPSASEIYSDQYRYQVQENSLSNKFCGAHRPGHFNGVLTVVLKLLQLVKPQQVYFGEKDYQQLQLVKEMVNAFFIDTKVIGCPIVRDEEGLALSSRNRRLNPEQRLRAVEFAKLLKNTKSIPELIKQLQHSNIIVDYIEDYENRRLAAVKIDDIRLIDNCVILSPVD